MTRLSDTGRAAATSDIWEQELAGETATQAVFLLTRRRFRELEWSEGLTQSKLAEQMGLTRAQISRWFSSPSNMTLRTASRLLMAMGRKLDFSVSDPFAVSPALQSQQPQFDLDPAYAEQGLRVPRRRAESSLAQEAGSSPATAMLIDFAAARAARDLADDDIPQKTMRAQGGSSWKLAAKAGDRPERADAEPKSQVKKPQWLGEIKTDNGVVECYYLDKVVIVRIDGSSDPQKMNLDDHPYTLKAVAGNSDAFYVADLRRPVCVKFIDAIAASPADHSCSWD